MNLVWLVVAMAFVTYVPRMLPMVLLQNVRLPLYVKRFMELIPFAALGALIFPGVLSSTGTNHMEAAIIGSSVAVVLAWLEANLIMVVAGGITGAVVTNIFL